MNKRIKQKGIMCSVEGCDNWCRSKGLCINHSMALRRYGDVRGGKVNREGICKTCGNKFRLIKSDQQYCNTSCYRKTDEHKKAGYEAMKKYRINNVIKSRARDIISKRISRNKTMQRKDCIICNTPTIGEAHHHNYAQPLNVTFLCKPHHFELHSWDSFN